jgi:uncharacterized protein (DUF885 family)
MPEARRSIVRWFGVLPLQPLTRSKLSKLFRKVAVHPIRVEPIRHNGPSAMCERSQRTIAVEVGQLNLCPKFEVMPLMLHEGLPGHHFQLGRERESEGRYGIPASGIDTPSSQLGVYGRLGCLC